jgi:hypothetical protein
LNRFYFLAIISLLALLTGASTLLFQTIEYEEMRFYFFF